MSNSVMFKRPIDGAKFMFELGFKVFPLRPNMKTPAFNEWQTWANTASLIKIESFGVANPLYNWGVYCGGSELTVLDIDNKKDKKGDDSLALLQAENEVLPRTFTVTTPTNGRHLYFNGKTKNTVGVLGEGLDTRSEGGYVVCPGSRIDEKTYEIAINEKVQGIPAWLVPLISHHSKPVTLSPDSPIIQGERNSILTSLAGSMRKRGMDADAIYAALSIVNIQQLTDPLPDHEVRLITNSVSKYKPEDATIAAEFMDTPQIKSLCASDIDPESIKKRDWVMLNRYMGGFLSVIVSPGGVGKSTMAMLDAVSVATGAPLTGAPILKKGATWLFNTEDPICELERRMVAIALHHNIPLKELKSVHLSSGRGNRLILAKADKGKVVVNEKALEGIISHILEHNIVLFIIDPFIHLHECDENSNAQITVVIDCIHQIINRTGCAVGLVHHSRKPGANANPGDANDARGASSLVNAARIAHTIAPMDKANAKAFGIDPKDKGWYFRLDSAKANLQPPADTAEWFKRISVSLINGDNVGTIQREKLIKLETLKTRDERQADRQDLASCLNALLQVGEEKAIKDLSEATFTNPQFENLFKSRESIRSHSRFVLNGVAGGLQYGNKYFKVKDYGVNFRPRYFIKCEQFNDESVKKEDSTDYSFLS